MTDNKIIGACKHGVNATTCLECSPRQPSVKRPAMADEPREMMLYRSQTNQMPKELKGWVEEKSIEYSNKKWVRGQRAVNRDGYKAGAQAMWEKLSPVVESAKQIKSTKGMTQLANCCVSKTCTSVWENGEHVANCGFQWGVLRGHNENASCAEQALKDAGLIEEGE